MKNDTGGVTVGKFVRLKSTMYYIFVDDNNEHKKAKGVNRNIIATVGDNKYKHVLLNNKCLNIQTIEFKVKIKEQKPMKPKKLYCLALVAKYIFKVMNMINILLVIRVTYKKPFL